MMLEYFINLFLYLFFSLNHVFSFLHKNISPTCTLHVIVASIMMGETLVGLSSGKHFSEAALDER